MRKRLLNTILILLLALSLFKPVYVVADSDELDYVTDAAYILSEDEWAILNEKAEAASEKYGCDILIITVEDMDRMHVEDYAQAVYDEFKLGRGGDKSGIMLLISMTGRDYDIMAHGYGNVAFTDYGKDKLAEEFLPDLSAGNYFNSFAAYIETCERYLELARDGKPVDVGTDPEQKKKAGKVVLMVVPFVAALITIISLRAKMKTAKIQQKADAYIKDGGLKITGSEDTFLFRNIIRTKREKSGGYSGGTTVNSRGSSHKSGKF